MVGKREPMVARLETSHTGKNDPTSPTGREIDRMMRRVRSQKKMERVIKRRRKRKQTCLNLGRVAKMK